MRSNGGEIWNMELITYREAFYICDAVNPTLIRSLEEG
jgi:hypothetical protein